jgi:hypothetical protein
LRLKQLPGVRVHYFRCAGYCKQSKLSCGVATHVTNQRSIAAHYNSPPTMSTSGPTAGGGAPVPAAHQPAPGLFRVLEAPQLAVEVDEGGGNAFHLGPILRKYTSARLAVKGARRTTTVELPLLYDALGLLRSLQYDVAEFNSAAIAAAAGTPLSPSALRYACYRLTRQASAFGVRVPRPGTPGATVDVPGLDALVAFVEAENADAIAAARGLIAGGVVDFPALPELFRPGVDVLDRGAATGLFGVPTAMRVRASYVSRGKSLFGTTSTAYVAVEFVVSVGAQFAVVEAPFPIAEFPGTRSVSEGLEHFVTLSAAARAELHSRGQRYERMNTSATYAEYAPGSFLPVARGGSGGSGPARPPARSRGGGRVMVDSSAAWARGVHCARSEGVAAEAVKGVLKLVAQRARLAGGLHATVPSTGGGDAAAAAYTAGSGGQTAASDEEGSLELLLLSAPLPPSLLALTWPVVAGFSFHTKGWGVVMVSGLREVAYNEAAFERLVLPDDRKRLIRALVTSHGGGAGGGIGSGGSSAAPLPLPKADLIEGKGEGTIILLHGPPGCGKTLTAEAVAELLHVPLYAVSMGELGVTPEALEERLADVLELCAPWRALVLIDEAEMLLEARSKADVLRNAMVCVMLRLLEYHRGILFLTTNRVGSLDPAFQSRVQCALRYDALDAPGRRAIWADLLARVTEPPPTASAAAGSGDGAGAGAISVAAAAAAADRLSAFDLARLADHALNGRQIKNALQLALALAASEAARLAQRHLDTTVSLTTAFATEVAGGGGGQ